MDAAFPPPSETFIMKVQGHDMYQDENGNVLVLLKDSGNILVPVTDNNGVAYTDPTVLLNVNTSNWFTPDSEGDLNVLDVIEESGGEVDRTPDWGPLLPKDGKPLFQDNNTDSLTSNLVGTDVGNDENPVIVVITNNTGTTVIQHNYQLIHLNGLQKILIIQVHSYKFNLVMAGINMYFHKRH